MFVAIVPAHNEEESIGSVVRSLFKHVDMVVVINDGSLDTTEMVAREAGAVVLTHEINRGQGAALQTGHEYALSVGAEYVLHFDGDGQFSVEDIAPAYEAMVWHGAQVLFGSRFLDGRSKVPWTKKNILFPVAKLVHKVFGGPRLSDIQNGFRILSRDALLKIKINQDRMAHATEIPAEVNRLGLPYVEFPVQVRYREYGLGLGGGVGIVRDLFFGRFI